MSNMGGNAPKRINGINNDRRKQQEVDKKRTLVEVNLELSGNDFFQIHSMQWYFRIFHL